MDEKLSEFREWLGDYAFGLPIVSSRGNQAAWTEDANWVVRIILDEFDERFGA